MHRCAAAGLDVGGQAHQLGEVALERPGSDGGEVGLHEDVVDRFRQLAGHRRRDRVDLVAGDEGSSGARTARRGR